MIVFTRGASLTSQGLIHIYFLLRYNRWRQISYGSILRSEKFPPFTPNLLNGLPGLWQADLHGSHLSVCHGDTVKIKKWGFGCLSTVHWSLSVLPLLLPCWTIWTRTAASSTTTVNRCLTDTPMTLLYLRRITGYLSKILYIYTYVQYSDSICTY